MHDKASSDRTVTIAATTWLMRDGNCWAHVRGCNTHSLGKNCQYMLIALKLAWFLLKPIAIFLIYLTFLYEDEEGRIQDRIAEWWVRLDDLQSAFLSRSATFMRGCAKLGFELIEFIFGAKLFSFRLFGTSFYFSIASIQVALGFAPRNDGHWPFFTGQYHPTNLLYGSLFFISGLVPDFNKNR